MKLKIEPINKELFLADNEIIVSKTDAQGRLTYSNETFIAISGFQEQELLGQQHNIVRHPDMPRGVFNLLWERIKDGKEFNGYIKNIRKDGAFYWVFANVTPSYGCEGQLMGYYSVRRKPSQEALSLIKPLYEKMRVAEQQSGGKEAISASTAILNNMLTEKGVSYDEFVCAL
ncbi:MAG: PAS domain-containing protein [Candidatus Polarisedimenticolaceae bacterium]|nr:PAS domain-containing protein [Candidatus Polarisedimenticolaceae bacterium]